MRFIMPRFFINCERWKWNDDLRIYVSTHGHIKDEHKKNIAAKIGRKGYFVVYLNHKVYNVHRLVLMTWRPLPNDGTPMTVDHLDSNRRNNHLENLEWVSQEENWRRAAEIYDQTMADNDCKICENFKPRKEEVKPAPAPKKEAQTNSLFPVVTWKDMEEKYDLYRNKIQSQYWPEGLTEKLLELWDSGEVKIYRGNTNAEITKEYLMENKIKNQPNKELLLERFLRHSLERHGKYLSMNPWMRWSK